MNIITKLYNTLSHIIIPLSLWGAMGLSSVSCSSSEDTTPSYADTDRMETLIDRSIPTIADFCDKYGTYLLYDFDQRLDFAYQFEHSAEWDKAEINKLTKSEAADAADFLIAKVFNCYTDDFKKKYLPRKILLTSSVKTGLSTVLGRSYADARGFHSAMANINSVTLARLGANGVTLDPAEHDEYTRKVHSALLSAYLVQARATYPVGDNYFKVSKSYYTSLMKPDRTQAKRLGLQFFHERGFFFPEDDESTYFVSGQQDMEQFIDSIVGMTQDMHDELLDITPMAQKVCILANSLKDMGVDITAINPLVNDFMDASLFGIAPAITAQEVIANSDEATFNFIVYRGARDLAYAEVSVNGGEPVTIDMAEHTKDARVACSALLKGLKVGDNTVTVKIYEVGRRKASYTEDINVQRVSLDNVQNFTMSSTDAENNRRVWSLHQYVGWDYTTSKNMPGMTMMRFYQRAYDIDYSTGEEFGRMQRFWRIIKENGRVTKIDVIEEHIDYTTYTQEYLPVCTYTFNYNEFGELDNVMLDDETIVSNVAYIDGNISRYSYRGKEYTPKYATANGKTTRVDCLDENMKGNCFTFTGKEDLNPYYISGLPAVIPGNEAGIPLQTLYSQYLFNNLEGVFSTGWALDGNVNMCIVSIGETTWNYNYILK